MYRALPRVRATLCNRSEPARQRTARTHAPTRFVVAPLDCAARLASERTARCDARLLGAIFYRRRAAHDRALLHRFIDRPAPTPPRRRDLHRADLRRRGVAVLHLRRGPDDVGNARGDRELRLDLGRRRVRAVPRTSCAQPRPRLLRRGARRGTPRAGTRWIAPSRGPRSSSFAAMAASCASTDVRRACCPTIFPRSAWERPLRSPAARAKIDLGFFGRQNDLRCIGRRPHVGLTR